MRKELLDRAEKAVAAGKKAGAAGVWARADRSRQREFRVRDGKPERISESTSRSLAIDVYVDGRFSSHSTTDLRSDSVETFLAKAIAMTRALEPDAYREMPSSARFAGRPEEAALELTDPKAIDLANDDCLAWATEMDELSASAPERITATSYASASHSLVAMASSNGFSGSRESTFLGTHTELTVRDGDKRPQDGFGIGVRHVADLPPARAVVEEALRLARARLGERKGPTTRTLMVVDRMAAGSMIYRLLGPADGRSVQQKQSFWTDRLGKDMVSDKLTLTDDPLIPRGHGSRTFDGDGISARPMPIVTRGVFANLYIDNYYGKKLGMAPTTGGASNLVVTPGQRDLAAILGDVANGIYVLGWLGGNIDPTTGDFSYGARGAVVENGALGQPVSEMVITGNILSLFRQLAEVGSDPWIYASVRAPTLVFSDVQFSGA